MVGFHVPVYRTQTGCGGCADPIAGNLHFRRTAAARGTQATGDFRPEREPASGIPVKAEKGLLASRGRLSEGNEVWQAVCLYSISSSAAIGYHILFKWNFARAALWRNPAGTRRAGANRITSASNRIKDQGYVPSGGGSQYN